LRDESHHKLLEDFAIQAEKKALSALPRFSVFRIFRGQIPKPSQVGTTEYSEHTESDSGIG
jgi:hypothetical protein